MNATISKKEIILGLHQDGKNLAGVSKPNLRQVLAAIDGKI